MKKLLSPLFITMNRECTLIFQILEILGRNDCEEDFKYQIIDNLLTINKEMFIERIKSFIIEIINKSFEIKNNENNFKENLTKILLSSQKNTTNNSLNNFDEISEFPFELQSDNSLLTFKLESSKHSMKNSKIDENDVKIFSLKDFNKEHLFKTAEKKKSKKKYKKIHNDYNNNNKIINNIFYNKNINNNNKNFGNEKINKKYFDFNNNNISNKISSIFYNKENILTEINNINNFTKRFNKYNNNNSDIFSRNKNIFKNNSMDNKNKNNNNLQSQRNNSRNKIRNLFFNSSHSNKHKRSEIKNFKNIFINSCAMTSRDFYNNFNINISNSNNNNTINCFNNNCGSKEKIFKSKNKFNSSNKNFNFKNNFNNIEKIFINNSNNNSNKKNLENKNQNCKKIIQNFNISNIIN